MLLRLLKNFLDRYRVPLLLVVIFQFCQTVAVLYLPSLNANIIDKGIARGDNGYIWRTGALMLGVTVLQAGFAIVAVYFASRTAMGFGCDVRSAIFHRVTDFSAREVNE